MKVNKPTLWLMLFVAVFFGFSVRAAAADNLSRVLILPFQIHAEKDLGFLKKGIVDMLSSRLAVEGRVELINPAPILQAAGEPATEGAALLLGEKLNADFIAFGSLTIFGGSISTDARFIDVKQKKPAVLFNQSGKSHDDVIFHINQFADRVNSEVFGRKVAAAQSPSTEPPKPVSESRRHPEAIFNEAGGSDSEYAYESSPEKTPRDFSVWRSSSFAMGVKSMAVGDVDGDGKNETVLLGSDTLLIYRHSDGRFQKLAEIKAQKTEAFFSVDIADINANGKAEIFVGAEDIRSNPSVGSYSGRPLRSFVLEWSGAEFVRIVDQEKWYFRVIQVPKRGQLLLGQKRGFQDPFAEGVYLMAWENGKYEAIELQQLPKDLNVFSFAYGDVMNTGEEMTLAFNRTDDLLIFNRDREQEWKSTTPLGGNLTYFEYPMPNTSSQGSPVAGEKEMDTFYISARILVVDMDRDGKNEVLVVNNRESTLGKVFTRFRSYKSGYIECLFWDTLGLYPKWKTRTVSGYISDYAVADFDNDGSPELVFSVDPDPDPLLKQPKSYLVSWKLKPTAQK
ncbi:MAG: VCBS repeat-containing protein [Thermodesulfobacteriota bacterium]